MTNKKKHTLLQAITREPIAISVRAFVAPSDNAALKPRKRRKNNAQSEYTLVFDTETTVDQRQNVRVGAFQFRAGHNLVSSGLFYDPTMLTKDEIRLIQRYAEAHMLKLMTVSDFVENVLYDQAYELRANIVGFNLPFDISRLAIRHNSARGETMRGGFTFQLSKNPWRPRIQIKHLSSRAALIQFTKPRRRFDTRGMRKRGLPQAVRRGSFLDLKTIAAALTSQSHSLASLADFLQTAHRKQSNDEHGRQLTEKYLDYAVNDVQMPSIT